MEEAVMVVVMIGVVVMVAVLMVVVMVVIVVVVVVVVVAAAARMGARKKGSLEVPVSCSAGANELRRVRHTETIFGKPSKARLRV